MPHRERDLLLQEASRIAAAYRADSTSAVKYARKLNHVWKPSLAPPERIEDESEAQRPGPRKFQALDVRVVLHEEVLELRREGSTYRQIAAKIEKDFGIRLCKSTISDWTGGKTSPIRAGHSFVAKPAPELAYVIGVETGDGFLNVKVRTYQYRIRLRAVDREFVEAFSLAVSKVLGCPPHRLWKGEKARETEVEFGSDLLHKFLSQKLDDLKPFIEHDKACAAAFIRGFFDSEGCVNTRREADGEQYLLTPPPLRPRTVERKFRHRNHRASPRFEEGINP